MWKNEGGMDAGDNGTPITQQAENIQKAGPVLRARRAIAVTVAFFVVQFFVGIVVGVAAGVYAMVAQGKADASTLASAIGRVMLPSAIAGEAVGAMVAFWMTRRVLTGPIDGGSLAPVGWRKALAFETAMAALAGCLLSLIYVFILVRISPPNEGQAYGPLATATLGGGWPRHLWAFLALVLAPPIEEFVFRGVLLEGLSNSVGVRAAAAMVTVAFIATHFSEALAYWPAWAAIALLASAALLFRLKTRSLIPAISVHAAYNLGLVITVYAGSG
jgi:membrane protease YdiL (CAAX protease family)